METWYRCVKTFDHVSCRETRNFVKLSLKYTRKMKGEKMLYTRWYFLFSLMPPTIMYQSLSGDTFTKKHFFKYIYFRLNLEILCVCFLY